MSKSARELHYDFEEAFKKKKNYQRDILQFSDCFPQGTLFTLINQ